MEAKENANQSCEESGVATLIATDIATDEEKDYRSEFLTIANQMIRFQRKHLAAHSDDSNRYKANMSSEAWHREFKTIHLAGPRRIGHTTTLLELAKQFEKPVMIVLSDSSDFEIRKISDKIGLAPWHLTVIDQDHASKEGVRRIYSKADVVLIDSASRIPAHTLSLIYRNFSQNLDCLFILMQ